MDNLEDITQITAIDCDNRFISLLKNSLRIEINKSIKIPIIRYFRFCCSNNLSLYHINSYIGKLWSYNPIFPLFFLAFSV